MFVASVWAQVPEGRRVGIIGLDTSHSIAFTRILNDPRAETEYAGYRVVAAYPHGSAEIESSVRRIPEYTAQIRELGVEIVDSIPELLKRVDAVLLETNDGRPHLEQVLPVLAARKPVFVDKPLAGDLASAIAIVEASRETGTPVFSASGLRFFADHDTVRSRAGQVEHGLAWSPAHLEPTHPDLYWYGIHGVEQLYTVMGPGCESVVRVHTPGADVVVGTWPDGRTGTVLGLRSGKTGYGGVAFGQAEIAPLGSFGGYQSLVAAIARFFQTGVPPVSNQETLEIYTFMEAADESKRRGGVPVKLAEVLEAARVKARELR